MRIVPVRPEVGWKAIRGVEIDAADNFNDWVAGNNTHFENKDLAFSFQEMPPVLSTISFFSITQPYPAIVATVPLAPLQEDVRSDFCKARHETYPCHMPKVPETQY